MDIHNAHIKSLTRAFKAACTPDQKAAWELTTGEERERMMINWEREQMEQLEQENETKENDNESSNNGDDKKDNNPDKSNKGKGGKKKTGGRKKNKVGETSKKASTQPTAKGPVNKKSSSPRAKKKQRKFLRIIRDQVPLNIYS